MKSRIEQEQEQAAAMILEAFKRAVRDLAVPDRPVKCKRCGDDPSGLIIEERETELGYKARVAVSCPDCNGWMTEHGYRTIVETAKGIHEGVVTEKLLIWLRKHEQITPELFKLGIGKPRSIFLSGPTGTGKTSVTLKWANDILEKTRDPDSVIFWSEPFLIETLEDDPDYIFQRLQKGFVYLAIDDFGDEVNLSDRGNRSSTTARKFQAYDRIFNWLYSFGRYQRHIIVINSNRTVAEIYGNSENGRAKQRRVLTITYSEQQQAEQSGGGAS